MVVAAIKEISSRKIIIFGTEGMLGHALKDVFPNACYLGRKEVDITDDRTVNRIIREERPYAVINAAAYTDVDGCEDHRNLALAVNCQGPAIIAAACAEAGALMVHFSTDYVFDGTQHEYRETDPPNPINIYGRSKLAGEIAIQENTDDYRIIRTSWLFGEHGRNFVDTVLSRSKQNPVVRIVDDQHGKPTYTVDLARKTQEILSCEPGIYHITNDGVCSWFEFARAFIPNAIPCSTAEFPRIAKRPAFSVLINTKTKPLRHWRDAVAEYIQKKGTM